MIPRYDALSELEISIDHETLHIDHHQATGVYGATAETIPTTLAALRSEGLATFVSGRMNPGASLDAALLQPAIPESAQPHLSEIAGDLPEHLDMKDVDAFEHCFVAGRQPAGLPPRPGTTSAY